MATTTPNFGWPVPTSTDLVKDGATAIEALGDAIDASLVDLEGGTTGQILAKASNADMDFTWTTPNPGDITAVTAGTGITGGGTSGAVTVSFDIANYGGGQYAAGKNKLINGDFGIWQRGTSFTITTSGLTYTADRWYSHIIGTTVGCTVSQQAFTAGTAPVSGYEGQYFIRQNVTTLTGQAIQALGQRIEDVRTYAGQTVTLSFWAKADASRNYTSRLIQNFGSGGSTEVLTSTGATHALTTSWQRFTVSVAVPSVSGKTIGTNSYFALLIDGPSNTANTLDAWGVQVEIGSVATAFQTATGTIQGELAACQRYYYKSPEMSVVPGAATFSGLVRGGVGASGQRWIGAFSLPSTMRTTPTCVVYNPQTGSSGSMRNEDANTNLTVSGIFGQYTNTVTQIDFSTSTTANNVVVGYITASAEL